jgi:hypothetical protein
MEGFLMILLSEHNISPANVEVVQDKKYDPESIQRHSFCDSSYTKPMLPSEKKKTAVISEHCVMEVAKAA